MSGIAALVSLDGRPVPQALAAAQVAVAELRGDRPARQWNGDGIVLAHANMPRTPEAEREELPACDQSGRFWLTWDGRLDNREELARLLRLESGEAQAMSDADYVLAAYCEWGDRCVQRLLGDWAFVAWDSWQRRLFCAKDPLGWRPLFYAERDGLLCVASEPRQLFAGDWLSPEPNHEFVLRFIAGAAQPDGETCHAAVMELSGGMTLSVQDGRIQRATYWTAPEARERNYSSPEAYVEEFEHTFELAVQARLRSNRKVGLFLSGGLDSSYVAAIAAAEGVRPLGITGYASSTELMDERAYADIVARHLGMPRIDVDISDCWTLSSAWVDDAMFDDVNHAAQFASHIKMATVAADEGVGVLLGGDGADDWMSGLAFVGDALAAGRPRTSWRLSRTERGRRGPFTGYCRAVYRDLAPLHLRDAAARMRGRPGAHVAPPFVRWEPGWRSTAAVAKPTARPRKRFVDASIHRHREVVRRSIHWRDRHAFAPNGIEHRAPFQDLRIIELMAATPEWVKRFNGRRKDILRQAVGHVLPAAIADRKDDDGVFNELLFAGLRGYEAARVRIGLDALTQLSGIDSECLAFETERWLALEHPWGMPLMRAITVGLWLNNLGVSRSPLVDRRHIPFGKEVRT